MNREIAMQWIADLRSGRFQQGKGLLHYIDDAGVDRFCCLGVLCERAVEADVIERAPSGYGFEYGNPGATSVTKYGSSGATSVTNLPGDVLSWAEMENERLVEPVEIADFYKGGDGLAEVETFTFNEFTALNDDALFSFDQIADVIEAQWERL